MAKEHYDVLTAGLKSREKDFVEFQKINIFCGTWNVNGKKPPESLEKWLCDCDIAPDLYAVGFQEMDLTGHALLLENTSKAAPWEQLILNNISKLGDYVNIGSRQLVGMLICVFVKKEHMKNITEVKLNGIGCGLMGKMGNKGGVGIRCKFYDSTMCFINAHLSAHFDNVARRNQDYKDIVRRLVFGDEPNAPKIFDHDLIFWIGDLNYRIGLDDFNVRKWIREGRISELLNFDQLLIEKSKNTVFEEFIEAPITFLPTYKYDNGTNDYDTSEKQRAPAWCDRILWTGENIEEVKGKYKRHELLSSDHRPVSHCFNALLRQIQHEKRKEVIREIVKQLDFAENTKLQQCSFDCSQIEFGDIQINLPVTKILHMTNTSSLEEVVRYSFISKPNTQSICKSWLKIYPESGYLVPTETVPITFTLFVDFETASSLNLEKDKLFDIVVLHLDGGTDYYVEIKGNFLYSCFANSLDNLIRHPLSIRENKPIATDACKKLSIPKELWFFLDYLQHYVALPDLFRYPKATDDELLQIASIIDTGGSLFNYSGNPCLVGEAFLKFLSLLETPVIYDELVKNCIEASESVAKSQQILASFRTVNANVLYYITAFLRDLLKVSGKNRLSVSILATLFAKVLSREQDPDKLMGIANFIANFLQQVSTPTK